ncbi:MAG: hypothetical protein IJZ55_00370 [Lachnospiraceae bacterium]|nr:hypothetical protein [Lachnospiraceae bacterium]
MRIEQETRNMYVGNLRQTPQKTPEEVAENLKNGRVFSGKVQFPQDKIAERRKAAQDKAMDIVKTAFAGERILDTSVEQMESSLEKGTKEMIAAKAEINKIEEQKERIQKDSFLTSEEVQAELEALNKAEAHYKEQIVNGKKYEERTIQALTDIKLERAKQSPMVDATNEAEAVLDAAGKEVIGMLFEEAKEHIDTENEKKQAEAEEKAEQEKKLEERIEAMKAEKEEKKDSETPAVEQLEKSTRRMVKIAETGEAVQKELKAVVDRLKLDLEDLKGIEVDEGV